MFEQPLKEKRGKKKESVRLCEQHDGEKEKCDNGSEREVVEEEIFCRKKSRKIKKGKGVSVRMMSVENETCA